MNDTGTQSPAQNSDLAWQMEALQRQVFLLLLALIVVTTTMVFSLFYQSHTLSTDLEQNRPVAMQVIQNYSQNQRVIESIEGQLANYGATHPAFQPILKKDGIPIPSTPPVR